MPSLEVFANPVENVNKSQGHEVEVMETEMRNYTYYEWWWSAAGINYNRARWVQSASSMPGDQDQLSRTSTNTNYALITLQQPGSVRDKLVENTNHDKHEATFQGTAPIEPSGAWNTGEEEEVWKPVWQCLVAWCPLNTPESPRGLLPGTWQPGM